jgi:hypothetical protein
LPKGTGPVVTPVTVVTPISWTLAEVDAAYRGDYDRGYTLLPWALPSIGKAVTGVTGVTSSAKDCYDNRPSDETKRNRPFPLNQVLTGPDRN